MTMTYNHGLAGYNSTLQTDLNGLVNAALQNTQSNLLEGIVNMSISSANATAIAPESNMVTYRFKSPDLQDMFESYSGEQVHVALEGALNVIFGKGKTATEQLADLVEAKGLDIVNELSEDDEAANHEAQITSEVAFALATYQLSNSELDMPEDITLDPIYMQMEDQFRELVTKLSNDVAADKDNQDVITLLGEMEFFNRIELFNHNYDSKNDILMLTLTALNA